MPTECMCYFCINCEMTLDLKRAKDHCATGHTVRLRADAEEFQERLRLMQEEYDMVPFNPEAADAD